MIGPACGTYAFLHARLGALEAELLSDRAWEQLLDARSFDEQRPVLLLSSYRAWVGPTAETTAAALAQSLPPTVRKIERSLSGPAVRFLRTWARRDVLRNVKTILKGKALQRPEAAIAAELLDLGPDAPLPTSLLLGAANVEAVFDLLEATPLRHWIHEARRIRQRDPTLFGLDAGLDRLFYQELWEQAQHLGGSDRSVVQELVAREIDQVNLLWLLRYRLHYGLSPAETYYLLVPVTGRLGDDLLKLLVRQDTLAAMAARVRLEPFHSILGQAQSIREVEVKLWRYRARLDQRGLRRWAFTLGEALALLELKDMEIRDLNAVLEGIRLGASRQDVRDQLSRV